jgi:alkylation response protein AidB-like acyl-CoA dehydrogenase
MHINFSDVDVSFREDVKDFIRNNLSKDLQTKISNGGSVSKEETIAWQKALNKKKWFAPGWPKEYGGSEMSIMRKYILDLELSLADTPIIVPFGVTMIAPVLIEFGTKKTERIFFT